MTDDPTAHPEETLDRAIAGALPEAEQRALDRHLAVCPACVAHLSLARSCPDIHQPQPWDVPLNRRAVEGALASFKPGRWAARLPPMLPRRWALVAAGVLLGLGSAASAAWWHARRPDAGQRAIHVASSAVAPAPALKLPAPPPLNVPPSPAAEHLDDRAAAYRVEQTRPSAAALFEKASMLRESHRPDQAIVVFHKLQQLYPRSREARISFALVGRMLLERGHPAQALAQFDHHLAAGGEASEEALAGRATALARMGRYSAESETWRRLLDAYPSTVYAVEAKTRLSELGALPLAPAGSGGAEHGRSPRRP